MITLGVARAIAARGNKVKRVVRHFNIMVVENWLAGVTSRRRRVDVCVCFAFLVLCSNHQFFICLLDGSSSRVFIILHFVQKK